MKKAKKLTKKQMMAKHEKLFNKILNRASWLSKLSLYELVFDLSHSDLMYDFEDHIRDHLRDVNFGERLDLLNEYNVMITDLKKYEDEFNG